ncbi:MAG: hypothetical protein Q7R48_01865 [bacterium]|nr:hypothetical protein [bacterium]
MIVDSVLGVRTVFKKEPILIEGQPYYLELKGYGENGRMLYLSEHVSRDVYYGMYLDNALREFERLEQATQAGLAVPLPLAVVEIPREEYLRVAIKGFEKVVAACLLFYQNPSLVEEVIGEKLPDFHRDEDDCQKAALQILKWIENHPEGVEQGIRTFVRGVRDPNQPLNSFFNKLTRSADALLTGRRFGYLIRATKCPVRVGDPSDRDLDIPANRKIARQAGRTFRGLLELGLLHHCPGTGNWTLAGELTDLQDTFDLRREGFALADHMELVGKGDMQSFVRYLLGREHGGMLSPFFIEGVCGKKKSLRDATEMIACRINDIRARS